MEVDLVVLPVSTQDSNFHKNKAYFWLLWKSMLTFFYYEGKSTGLNSLPLIHNHYVGTKTAGFLDIPPNLESIRLRDLPCMKLLKAKCVVSGSFFTAFRCFLDQNIQLFLLDNNIAWILEVTTNMDTIQWSCLASMVLLLHKCF